MKTKEEVMSGWQEVRPYRVTLHYDPTRNGIWVGTGRLMRPLCGQTELIGVTNDPEAVMCGKCQLALKRGLDQ